jgi:hypothetical protein
MKLIILRKHLNLPSELLCRILSFEQLLGIVVAHLLSEFTCFRSDLLLNKVVNLVGVVEVDVR